MSEQPGIGRQETRAKLSHFYGLDQRDRVEGSPVTSQQGGKEKSVAASGMRTGRRPSIRRMNSDQSSPYDINSPGFDPDMFVSKVVKEASLSQLMAQEGEIVRQIQRLDSDMQTLVYENYNKFIAATETIRKMRVDFKSMEEEMDQLADSMGSITSFSSQISDKLRSRRQDVARLSSTHTTLKKLEFVLELPNRLTECLEEDNLAQALAYWHKASTVLQHYRDMPSFAGIQEDCQRIMSQVEKRLDQRLQDPATSRDQLAEAVKLLQQLGGRPEEQLYSSYLDQAAGKLAGLLQQLEQQVTILTTTDSKQGSESVAVLDPLEFVDEASNGFLGELTLTITSFNQTFPQATTDTPGGVRLLGWVEHHLSLYLAVTQRRLAIETDEAEVLILVRALDRFYRRLTAVGRVMPGLDVARCGLEVVLSVASSFCSALADRLNTRLEESLLAARQTIAAPRRSGGDSPALQLAELSTSLLSGVADSVREAVDTLARFLHPELSFSVKSAFRRRYGEELVVETVLIKHFFFIRETCQRFTGEVSVPGGLVLLLSRTCLDLHTSTAPHLAALLAERLQLPATPDIGQLNRALADTARTLLDRYVQVESGELSLMLRKSVEARDWLATVEPRSVRAVMKRIVEDVTIIDGQVGQLYEEGQKKARSSDSSRRTGARSRSAFSSRTLDSSSLASNIQNLFSERIDFFTPVKPAKVSVLTSIIKLGLKTLLECVRLKTFARYGLQQMQVDCHYLQLYLWRFVDDEAVVYHLLDEIMSSAIQRSLDQPPQLMEPSVVEVICDKV